MALNINTQFTNEALSFDDVLLTPSYSEVLPSEVSVESKLGPLTLRSPILSAAMDTVTDSQMAIAMALLGGVGVLHKNNLIDEQAEHVKRVKKFQHAVISEPFTVRAQDTIAQVNELIKQTGVTGFPVIDENGKLVGMCTGRDIRYASDANQKVADVMSTPALSLPVGSSQTDAVNFFRQHKVEKLPLVDQKGILKGLITSKDWRQASDHPFAIRDSNGSLLVAAAVGVGPQERERAEALVSAGADILTVDSAHGHSRGVLEMIKSLRSSYKALVIIGGNIGTAEGARAVIEAGANVVKIGVGPGSICTTRIVSGAGIPQLTAVMEATSIRKEFPHVSFISDGGIRYSGDITKALAAGADAVMLGSLLAGTEESPGDTILYMGRSYKEYRGMGSLSAMKKGSRDRYRQGQVSDLSKLVPEGVEARVPYRGKLAQVLHQLIGGLRSGMGYVGANNLEDLRAKARFRKISNVALRESHVHDVAITAEAPNYSGGSQEK